MRKYSKEDQDKIEDALTELGRTVFDEVGAHMAYVSVFSNGDVSANVLIDEDGSVFHIEVSNDGDRIVREHKYIPDGSSADSADGGGE